MDTPLAVTCASGGTCCGGACRKPDVFSYLAVPLRLGLGALFLLAAYNKLFVENGPQLFSASVKAFKVLDPETTPTLFQLAVFGTPWLEIFAGIAMIVGFWTRAASYVLAALLVLFIALLFSVIQRKLNLECGCFGKLSPFCGPSVSACNIYQNTVLLAMTLVVANAKVHFFSVDRMMRAKPAVKRAS